MATILECSELTKKYGSHRAVDNLNLQIERGRVYALLGPNGSGKSTFMKMAAGLIHPSSGKILFEGESVGKNSKAKTVYMPTESYFYSYMTWKDAGHYFADFYEDFQPQVYEQLLSAFSLEPKIARDQILETIQKYCSPTKTFLVSSHLVDDLERMTDDAIFMKNGGLVMCGKVDELTKHHGKTMTELYKEVYSDCVM